jgi:uncharacterized protein
MASATASLKLFLHEETYALAKLGADAPAPTRLRGRFQSVSRTPRELTVIAEQACFPPGCTLHRGLRCLEVDGEFTVDAVGVVAAVSAPIAAAGISLFLVSVWSTDYVLVAQADLARALAALRGAGHAVHELRP